MFYHNIDLQQVIS